MAIRTDGLDWAELTSGLVKIGMGQITLKWQNTDERVGPHWVGSISS